MAMHNLPHPGEFIIQVYLDPNNLSSCEVPNDTSNSLEIAL